MILKKESWQNKSTLVRVFKSPESSNVFRAYFVLFCYPNPAKDVVNITLTESSGLAAPTAIFYSPDGRPVKPFALNGQKITADISGLEAGVYLMKIGKELLA